MDVTTKTEIKSITTKRIKKTKAEVRLRMKEVSRVYYSTPEAKEKHRLKCIEYRAKTVDKRNARRRYLGGIVRVEKSLKRIWLTKGLIKDV
jgi:hypothetical protein